MVSIFRKRKAEVKKGLTRPELLELHSHYSSVVKDELNFCYQYLNFYIGLLSAILAATLAGLLNVHYGDIRGLALLLGPMLTAILALIGYLNVQVFYRRFVEAWVTTINIESMLQMRYATTIERGGFCPRYPTKEKGFIPKYELRPKLHEIFEKANQGETLAQELVKAGDTLRYARYTFAAFGIAVIVLIEAIVLTVFPDLIRKVWFIFAALGIVVIVLIIILTVFPDLIRKMIQR